MKSAAFTINRTGGPEVLEWQERDLRDPAAGELLVRQTVVGFNFIDTYLRSGRYPMALPGGIGMEAVGVVERAGSGTSFPAGTRVGYIDQLGSYATHHVVKAERTIAIPEDIDDHTAVAVLTKGITAHYLLHRTYRVQPGDVLLVHAAAGGVGLALVQWGKALGARVIGTVSSDAKAKFAAEAGCSDVIVTSREDILERVKAITAGAGVNVVYDSIGKDTWDTSMKSLRRLGTLVSFGSASGLPEPVDLAKLQYSAGSPFITRSALKDYMHTRAELLESAQAVFDAVRSGVLKAAIGRKYALLDAATAHKDAEARVTSGSLLLIPPGVDGGSR